MHCEKQKITHLAKIIFLSIQEEMEESGLGEIDTLFQPAEITAAINGIFLFEMVVQYNGQFPRLHTCSKINHGTLRM